MYKEQVNFSSKVQRSSDTVQDWPSSRNALLASSLLIRILRAPIFPLPAKVLTESHPVKECNPISALNISRPVLWTDPLLPFSVTFQHSLSAVRNKVFPFRLLMQSSLLHSLEMNLIRFVLFLTSDRNFLHCLTSWVELTCDNWTPTTSPHMVLSAFLIDIYLYVSKTTSILLLCEPSWRTFHGRENATIAKVVCPPPMLNFWTRFIPSIIVAEFYGRPSANGTSFWRGVTSAALFVFRGNPSVVAKDHGNGPKLYCSSSLTSIFRLWPMIIIRQKRDLSAFKTIVLPSVETFFFWLREEKVFSLFNFIVSSWNFFCGGDDSRSFSLKTW